MNSWYLLFKFLHVVFAAAWIGGMFAAFVLHLRLARAAEGPALEAAAHDGIVIGRSVIGPAAGLTLITGGLAMWLGHLGFAFWIVWGLAAMVVSMALGATFARRAQEALAARVTSAGIDDAEIAGLRRRLSRVQGVMLLILVSTVWVMVFKPVL